MAGEEGAKPETNQERGQAERPQQGTQPAQEWGERTETGKAIARGGKTGGRAEGAEEQQP